MVLGVLTGWLDRREREAVAYLIEENRLLRRQLGTGRPRLTDDDRRRLISTSGPLDGLDRILEQYGKMKLVGAVYDLTTGRARFFD